MSDEVTIPAFRSVPRTGVIYVTSEAHKLGYRSSDPAWCNLGQGQPETGPLPGAPPRVQEVSVRVSLGATRWQLVRQLLVESLILALVSGVVGLVLAVLCIRVFDAALPEGRPYYWAFTLMGDWADRPPAA